MKRIKGLERYSQIEQKERKSFIVNEIYKSINGEGPLMGYPVVIIRLTGCNLRCRYCDSKFSYLEGRRVYLHSLMKKIKKYGINKVLITGGEPLAQAHSVFLLKKLIEEGYETSIETNGTYSIREVPDKTIKVVDVKTPDSGSQTPFYIDNLKYLGKKDCLKFVICSRNDYEWAKNFLKKYKNYINCEVFFNPAYNRLKIDKLAQWILKDGLDVRLSLQFHKIIWGDKRGV